MEVDFPAIVAIIGNNGSGKSTFFNALRQRISFQGEFNFLNKNAESTFFSFLGVKNVFNFPFSTKDFIRINSDLDKGDECYQFLVDSLLLGEFLNKNIETLSQGQLQKCLIAQTLIQHNDIVLLDEPEAHLDIKSRDVLVKTIKSYVIQYKKIVFLVTHDLPMAERVADYVINFSKNPLQLQEVSHDLMKSHQEFLTK